MAHVQRTAFDRYRDQKLNDLEFKQDYLDAKAEIDAIDQLIRALDAARDESNLSKAELARRIGVSPEIVRRLLTSDSPNPTISTIIKVALALGMKLELVKDQPVRVAAAKKRKRPQVAMLRGHRERNSFPSLRTAS